MILNVPFSKNLIITILIGINIIAAFFVFLPAEEKTEEVPIYPTIYDSDTICGMYRHAAVEGERPATVHKGGDIYMANIECWMLRPGQTDPTQGNVVLEEYISECGLIIQQEDMTEGVYFCPSTSSAASMHTPLDEEEQDELQEEIDKRNNKDETTPVTI